MPAQDNQNNLTPQQPVNQVNINIPSVPLADAKGFSKVWKYKGLCVPIDDVYVQFASDYANIVLKNFVVQATMANIAAAQKAAQEAKPKILMEGFPDGK
jgi:hypothetical protein